jgi:hypothetical protein
MHKIVVEKNEAVADLVERILESESEEIRLVIPKKSHLLDSPSNFRLLAREAKTLGKTITVESVDENILALAKENGLASSHPLFDERDGAPVSDIVEKKRKRGARAAAGAVALKVHHEDEEPASEIPAEGYEPEEERYDTLSDYREASPLRRVLLWVGGSLAVILLGMWAFGALFGKAEVAIRFKKTPWTFNDAVAALTSVKDIDADRNIIPGQLFEEEKSLVQAFPASGRANVNDKARGQITIVNAYSSDSQQLVATTRFQTPDGKIYRLDDTVVVPGAQVVNGKITPASIKAPVTADQPGPSYNSGRVDKLTIPGFKGTPKFEGFYGVLENGISGGVTGERAVATDADVSQAESQVAAILRSSFKSSFLGAIPSDINVLDGASALTPGKIMTARTAGDDGKFTLTGNAVFEAFGFREKDLNALLTAKSGAANSGMKLQDIAFAYKSVQPDFIQKQLKFSLSATANMVPDFDADAFKGKLAGEKKDAAKSIIMALPQLEDAQVKLWPAWLRSLPSDNRRITVIVQ